MSLNPITLALLLVTISSKIFHVDCNSSSEIGELSDRPEKVTTSVSAYSAPVESNPSPKPLPVTLLTEFNSLIVSNSYWLDTNVYLSEQTSASLHRSTCKGTTSDLFSAPVYQHLDCCFLRLLPLTTKSKRRGYRMKYREDIYQYYK